MTTLLDAPQEAPTGTVPSSGTARPGGRGPDPGQARIRRRRRAAATVLALLLLASAALAVGWATRPAPALEAGPRTVEIPPALGLFGVAGLLAEQGVVRSRLAFVALAALRGAGRSLKAGEYEFPQGASLLTTLELIEVGKVKPHLVLLPEGFTIRELARELEAKGITSATDVIQAATSPGLAQGLGIEADGVEGYLFPDTYRVIKGMRIEDILGRMVGRFREKVATPAILERARAAGLTLHELLTLASIIEKEAVVPDERPIIAGVFWNRLKRGMPLQADPTVSYAVGKDGRAPTRQDLQADHPFNTYRNRGLPPGPIANPGLAAVEAALAPARVPYLYFVSIDDRRHQFSVTLEEHNRAVARYRQSRPPARAL